MGFSVRMATTADAEPIIAILEEVAAERIYTAITKPWSAAEQRRYTAALSCREAIHVAETERKEIIGYQVLELWAPTLQSMAHAGQIGTFVRAASRGQGAGAALFRATATFAFAQNYAKFIAQVRSRNAGALAFYSRIGFRECGRLTRQVRADGEEDDEILMEYFLSARTS
jgi:RimJ/RimL family protein N-acetyltransferase